MNLLEHKTFADHRGSYTPFPLDILGKDWTQCSISVNDQPFTFRGLHYQTEPAQEKYVKVIKGSIIDIAYDLKTETTYSLHLKPGRAVYLRAGYAHGFLTLEPDTIVVYLVKGDYSPESEHSIVWDTLPVVKEIVNQYTDQVVISDKDRLGK
jgi:dTDP-4-dehydrorhamnose 3,5-epimerase